MIWCWSAMLPRLAKIQCSAGRLGLAGSTRIGAGAILAGQVGPLGILTVGDGAVVTAKSGIPGDIPAKSLYSAIPRLRIASGCKNTAALNRLPDLQRRVLGTRGRRLRN